MTVFTAMDPMGRAGVRWTNLLDSLAKTGPLTSPFDLTLMPGWPSRRDTLAAKRVI